MSEFTITNTNCKMNSNTVFPVDEVEEKRLERLNFHLKTLPQFHPVGMIDRLVEDSCLDRAWLAGNRRLVPCYASLYIVAPFSEDPEAAHRAFRMLSVLKSKVVTDRDCIEFIDKAHRICTWHLTHVKPELVNSFVKLEKSFDFGIPNQPFRLISERIARVRAATNVVHIPYVQWGVLSRAHPVAVQKVIEDKGIQIPQTEYSGFEGKKRAKLARQYEKLEFILERATPEERLARLVRIATPQVKRSSKKLTKADRKFWNRVNGTLDPSDPCYVQPTHIDTSICKEDWSYPKVRALIKQNELDEMFDGIVFDRSQSVEAESVREDDRSQRTTNPHGCDIESLLAPRMDEIRELHNAFEAFLLSDTDVDGLTLAHKYLHFVFPVEEHGVAASTVSSVQGFLALGNIAGAISQWLIYLKASFTSKVEAVGKFLSDYMGPILMALGSILMIIVAILVSKKLKGGVRQAFLALSIGATVGMALLAGCSAVDVERTRECAENFTSYFWKDDEEDDESHVHFGNSNVPVDPKAWVTQQQMTDLPRSRKEVLLQQKLSAFEAELAAADRVDEMIAQSTLLGDGIYSDDEEMFTNYHPPGQASSGIRRIHPHANDFASKATAFAHSLGALFGVTKFLAIAKLLNDTLQFTRNMSGVFKFLVLLFPAVIQEAILVKFPQLVKDFLYDNSSWKLFRKRMDDSDVELKKPDTAVITKCRKLINECNNYLVRHAGEAWVVHAERHLSEFKARVKNTEARVKTAMHGRTPVVVQVTGVPGIGKSQAITALNLYASGIYRGRPDILAIYSRGTANQYWENVGDADIVTYSGFREADDATNLQQTIEIMDVCNPGGFYPPAAEIAKKDSCYSFGMVTLSSNTVYHTNIPTMNRAEALEAFNRRIEHKAYVTLNLEVFPPGFVASSANVREWIRRLAVADPARAAESPHLKFHPLKVLPPVLAHVAEYNQGRLLGEMVDSEVNAKLEDWGIDGTVLGGLTMKDYFRYLGKVAVEHGRRADAVTTAMSDMVAGALTTDGYTAAPEAIPLEEVAEPALAPWKKVLIAVSISTPVAAAIAGGLYMLLKKEDRQIEPHYGGRMRTILTNRQKDRLAAVRTTQPHDSNNDRPEEVFFDRLVQHTVMMRHADGSWMHGFLINGQHVLTMRHLFMRKGVFANAYVDVEYYPNGKENGKMIQRLYVEEKKLMVLNETGPEFKDDLICIPMEQPIPGIRDIRGYFIASGEVKKTYQDPFVCSTVDHMFSGAHLGNADKTGYYKPELAKIFAFDCFYFMAVGTPGACGAPIWTLINGSPRIIGLYNGGNAGEADGMYITKEKLERLPKQFYRQMNLRETVEHGCLPNIFKEETLPVPIGNFAPVASLEFNVPTNNRSQLKRTPFLDRSDLPESMKTQDNETCRVAPAILEHSIIPIMEEKYGIIRNPIPSDLLEFAELASDILYPPPRTPLKEWTIVEAVNSIPADASVGFGWTKRRKDLLE